MESRDETINDDKYVLDNTIHAKNIHWISKYKNRLYPKSYQVETIR